MSGSRVRRVSFVRGICQNVYYIIVNILDPPESKYFVITVLVGKSWSKYSYK